jgi:hypothetical protein
LLITKGVTEEIADEASLNLFENPPEHLGQHPKALLGEARRLFKASNSAQAQTDDAAEARRQSAGCEDCRGDGLTYRWRRKSAGLLDRDGKPLIPFILFYCTCAYGRFAERAHRNRAADVRKRFHDLQDYPWLWGQEYRQPPTEAEARSIRVDPLF